MEIMRKDKQYKTEIAKEIVLRSSKMAKVIQGCRENAW